MYVMSWSELGAFYTCGGGSIAASDPHGPGGLPGPKEKGLPGNVVKEDPAVWPEASAGARDGPAGAAPGTAAKMGQVSSVARAGDGAAWVLRRGPRAWDAAAFSGADGGQRALIGGLTARQFGLSTAALSRVFPGAQPTDLQLL